MAKRTVTVELEARTGKYAAEMLSAEKSTESVKDSVERVDKGLKKIPPDAAKAAAAMRLLGTTTDATGTKFATLGKKADQLKSLQLHIAGARAEVRQLGLEFNKTGDVGIFQDLFKATQELKSLERLQKQITVAMNGTGAAGAGAFAEGFAMTISKPQIVAVLAAAVMAALPAVGGLIGGTVGLVGIGGAIAGQIQNAEVKRAAKSFAEDFKAMLLDASTPMSGVIMGGLEKMGRMVEGNADELKDTFQELAPYAEMFFTYLEQAGEEFMPKFAQALRESGPMLGVLAENLPNLMSAVGDFFLAITRGAKGGAEGMSMLLRFTAGTVRFVGMLIEYSSKLFDLNLRGQDGLFKILSKIPTGTLPNPFKGLHEQTSQAIDDWEGAANAQDIFRYDALAVTDSIDRQANELQKLLKSWDDYFNVMMSSDEAAINMQGSLDDLTESIKDNGRHWDINTEKGRNNTRALLNAIQAAKYQYDANIASGMSSQKAAELYNTQINALERLAQQAGLAKSKVEALAGKYKVELDIFQRFHTSGHQTNVNSREYYKQGGVTSFAKGGVSKAAQAGIYPDTLGPIIQFAEPGTGKEGFLPAKGISRGRAGNLLSEMAAWHGYGLTDKMSAGGWRSGGGGGGAMPSVNLTVNLLDTDGRVTRTKLISDALNRGIPQAAARAAYP